ncbi:DMT family transporter [Olsenella profusa]|uniref:Multidrug efflux SMR transporter n=1 Tax=Olsenella profusa TaxID=138595 RepID=A0ABS2F040_9ACTN|nr:multidrug efflux SMR transporter [Olsenella profusa]MBM6774175.1 multidrug efflux SMR transporter [Olsenella profusa]
MDWVVLVVSGAMEAVWAVALDRAEGFTRPLPSIVFLAALVVSMLGLSHAVKTIPIGTAYAVWVGIGAAITVAYGMATGSEPFSWAKIVLLTGLVACVVGLKLVGESH